MNNSIRYFFMASAAVMALGNSVPAIAANTEAQLSAQSADNAGNDIEVQQLTYEPLEAVHDNLMLALNHIQHKSFREARFALNHAHAELQNYERHDSAVKHLASVQRISGEMDIIKASLESEDPALLNDAEAKIQSWLKEIEKW